MGILQAKAAAKLTGTFCGIARAFWRGWHFSTHVSVSMPRVWGHPPSAPAAPGTADQRCSRGDWGHQGSVRDDAWLTKASCHYSEDTEGVWFTSATKYPGWKIGGDEEYRKVHVNKAEQEGQEVQKQQQLSVQPLTLVKSTQDRQKEEAKRFRPWFQPRKRREFFEK